MIGGWNPGATLLPAPDFAGIPIGPEAAFVALRVEVHYVNHNGSRGIVAHDGLRLHYTPDLRPHELDLFGLSLLTLTSNPHLQIPPGKKRHFISKSCKLAGPPNASVNLAFVGFHAHLLGREMYSVVNFGNGTSVNIGSMPAWRSDSQEVVNLLSMGVELHSGDEMHGSCVFDSTTRTSFTNFGEAAMEEMCWIYFATWPLGAQLRCAGHIWEGELLEGESAYELAHTRPVQLSVSTTSATTMTTTTRATSISAATTTASSTAHEKSRNASLNSDPPEGDWRASSVEPLLSLAVAGMILLVFF